MQKHSLIIAFALLFFSAASMAEETDTATVARRTSVDSYANKVKVSSGPMWVDSKMYVSSENYIKNQRGFDVMVDYQHLWSSGIGVGVDYAYNRTSYSKWGHFTLIYLGPSFVYAYRGLNRFTFDVTAGLGYAYYMEPGYDHHGMGFMLKLGAEYQLFSNVGVGVEFSRISTAYIKPEGLLIPDDESYGIARYGVLAGLRFYF